MDIDYTYDLSKFKAQYASAWEKYIDKYDDLHNYKSIDDVPMELLYKYTSAQFHSGWMTWGFGLGRSETFVDLPIEQRRYNI